MSPLNREHIRVVAIGDSLAYGAADEAGKGIAGRLKEDLIARGFSSIDTANLGVNGAQTADLIARLRQERVRAQIAADAIVVSIGANDLFRSLGAREETLRAPLAVADRILTRVEGIVAGRFEHDPLISVVKMSDIITRQKLSRYDNFHPGGAAYAAAAERIAEMLSA